MVIRMMYLVKGWFRYKLRRFFFEAVKEIKN